MLQFREYKDLGFATFSKKSQTGEGRGLRNTDVLGASANLGVTKAGNIRASFEATNRCHNIVHLVLVSGNLVLRKTDASIKNSKHEK